MKQPDATRGNSSRTSIQSKAKQAGGGTNQPSPVKLMIVLWMQEQEIFSNSGTPQNHYLHNDKAAKRKHISS